jgi:pyrimidine operon attenuation protein/uracil phosphoribosyltransferase
MTSSQPGHGLQTELLNEADIQRTLKRLTHELLEANKGVDNLVLMGIVTRGQFLAERVGRLVTEIEGTAIPVGSVDITLYRDDAGQSLKPAGESNVPVDLTGKRVVLVDDVIFSGRSVRAALDALNAFGRPSSVQLMVLLDRGHRQLPISPNFIGKNVPTSLTERVSVQVIEVDGQDRVVLEKPTE